MHTATAPAGRADSPARRSALAALAAVAALSVLGAALSCGSASTDTMADAATEEASSDAMAADATDATSRCVLTGRYGSPSCESCLRATCCDVITSCTANAPCAALQTCALDCLEQTDAGGCLGDCERSHPDGNARWQAVYLGCWFAAPPQGCLVECT